MRHEFEVHHAFHQQEVNESRQQGAGNPGPVQFDRSRIVAVPADRAAKRALDEKTRESADGDGPKNSGDHLPALHPVHRLAAAHGDSAAQEGENQASRCGDRHSKRREGIKENGIGDINREIYAKRFVHLQAARIEDAFPRGLHHARGRHRAGDDRNAGQPDRTLPGHHARPEDRVYDVGGVVPANFNRVPDEHPYCDNAG